MEEKSQMEMEYESYLSSDNTVIVKDGITYYKIVSKLKVTIDKEKVLICIPWKMFGNQGIRRVRDEYGNQFDLGETVHYSFRSFIPQWYKHTLSVIVEGIDEVTEIGDYLTIVVR